MCEKNFKEENLVPWDLPGVPRVPISAPNRGIFSKLIRPGPLGSGGHSHTSFINGIFRALETSFHIDVSRLLKKDSTQLSGLEQPYTSQATYLVTKEIILFLIVF